MGRVGVGIFVVFLVLLELPPPPLLPVDFFTTVTVFVDATDTLPARSIM